jgi:hypothetical protein
VGVVEDYGVEADRRKVEEKHSDSIVEWLMWDSGVATDEIRRRRGTRVGYYRSQAR